MDAMEQKARLLPTGALRQGLCQTNVISGLEKRDRGFKVLHPQEAVLGPYLFTEGIAAEGGTRKGSASVRLATPLLSRLLALDGDNPSAEQEELME